MKISLSAIRAYNTTYGCAPDPAPDGVDALLARIGAQLAAVEETIDVGSKYESVIIARVVECRRHENSDHLNVCLIDAGSLDNPAITPDVNSMITRSENGLIQVVCGAPNVRAGLLVAWLPPGATVPSSAAAGEPFVLSVREIRGEVSHGMLASPQELAIGDSHDGILEIDGDIEPGTSFAAHYGLAGDVVIDMENKMFTHRPDCFGALGIARELAGIQGQQFQSPDWYRTPSPELLRGGSDGALPLSISVDDSQLVPRLMAVSVQGVAVAPSPVWLQVELARLGARPINNLVDITNYVMLLTGQPLHAYDYDKVAVGGAARIGARTAYEAESVTLLSGKTVALHQDDIVITDGTRPIGLAGVMGGADTEVSSETTNIILECASFDMFAIRRSSMRHGLFTDAVTRFNKGQSPSQNDMVAAYALQLIQQLAGGTIQVVCDTAPERSGLRPEPVTVTAAFVGSRLGLALPADDIARVLGNVEFDVQVDGDQLSVSPPFWRTDIEIPEDIVEEVGRLYGYDKLPLALPLRDLSPADRNPAFELKSAIRDILSRSGANEVLSYSFVHGNLIDQAGQNRELAYKLSNALSPDLQYYRLSITPSLLEKVHSNIRAGYDELALFEIAKAHGVGQLDDAGLPMEFGRVALVYAADDKRASREYAGAAFYQARRYLDAVFGGALPYELRPLAEIDLDAFPMIAQMVAPYDPARSAVLWTGSYVCGVIGEFRSGIRRSLKLPQFSAGFELFRSSLKAIGETVYTPQSRFPKVWQDICLRVPATVNYGQLEQFARTALTAAEPANTAWTLTPVDIFSRRDDQEHRQITFRYTVASYDRTLTDPEVAAVLDTLTAATAAEFGAERV